MLEIVSSLKFSQLLNQATTESLITVEADGTVSVRDGAATYLKEITLGLPSVLYASSSLNFTPANTAQSLNLAVQTAGNIFAAPAAVNGSPSFRALVASDIPGLDASKIISGTFSDTFISSAAVWNAKQDALVSGTNIKTVGGQTILGSGDITLASLNYWTKTGFVLSYESTDNATGKATFNGGFEIYSTAPNHSLKQRVTMQTWRTQIGANTGAAGGSYYSIFNVTGGNHGLTVTTDGNVAIGTLPTSESSSNSRLYVYGGATGANIDVRGLDVAFKDQATLELQGSEYSTAYSSTRLQHRGANYGTSVSILGLVTQNFGELTFQEVSGAVIRSTNTTPILVGINNLEVARFLVGGFKVTGSIEYSTTLKPNGNAGTSGYFLKTTGTTNSWSAITLADISDYSAANINYWTLEAGNVYRSTGKVFVGNQYDLGNYTFQVSGDTVTTGKINVGYVPNPSAQVEVYGGANFRYPSSDNNSLYVRMGTYISSGLYGTFLKSDSYYASTLVTNLHLGITDVSGTDKALITLKGSNSFVGINTINPLAQFVVANNDGNSIEFFPNYGSNVNYIQSYDRIANTYRDFGIKTNSSLGNFIVKATTGYVGVGTPNPLANVHLNYAGVANTFVLVGHNNGGTYFGHNADNRGVIAGYLNTDIVFGYNQSATFVETSRMVAATGNFGINKTDPSHKLDVNGNGRFITELIVESNTTSNTARLALLQTGSNYWFIDNVYPGDLKFIRGTSNHLTITNVGKVLVGVGENGSKTFQVNGGIRQNDVISGLVYANSIGEFQTASTSDLSSTLGDTYIKNQSSYDQVASFRINGTGIFAHSSPIRFDNAGNQDIHSNNGGTVRFINSAYSYANVSFYQNGDVYIRNNVAIATGLSTNTRIRVDVPENYYALEIVKNGQSYGGLHFNENIFQFGMAGITAFDFNSNGTSRIRVSTTGLVGVNTTNPNYTLDVNGIIRALGAIKLAPQVSGEYAQDATLSYYAAGNGVYLNGNNTGFLRLNADGNQHTNITLYGVNSSTASIIDFLTSANTRVRIDSTGKVLIGTVSTFTGDTLQVNGSILQRNVIASSILKVLAADSNGTIVEADQTALMEVLGDSAYIKNQNGTIQSANFRINGTGRAGEFYADAVGGNIYAAYGWLRNSYTQFYLYTYGNTENDLRLARYTDVGGYAGNVFVVYRATGKMYFDNNVRIGGGEGATSYRLDVAETLRVGGQGGTDVTTIGGGSGVGSYLNMYYADGTVNNVLTGNGINALSSYLGGTIIGGFSYSNNGAKLIVRGSTAGFTATGTSSNRSVQISNYDIAYGLHFGVYGSGASWIQSGRADTTQTYDLWLQHEGSSVIVGNTYSVGGYKLQVHGDIWSNGYVYLRLTSPSMLFSDTDARGGAIHVNSSTFYVLRLDDAGTSWQSNGTGLWPLEINLENYNARFGGAVSQEYTKSSLVYANSSGTLTSATAQNVKDLLGDGAYIKNQFANAQAGAYFWIEQYARVGGYSMTGTQPRFSVTGDHSTTNFSLYSIGNGAGNDSSLDMWASEPGLTYDGCGIGHNINNSPYYGRRNTSQGQSYIRFYAGHVFISAASSERTNPSASTWIFNSNGIFYWGGSGGDKAQLTWDSGYAAVQSINGNRLILGVAGGDSNLMTLTTTAKVLVGTTSENSYKMYINGGSSTADGLYVNGKIFATDDIQSYSDKRLKENFKDIIIGNKLKDFKIQQYNKIGSHRLQIGVIAQELAEIFPQLVSKEGSYFGVSYSGIATLALGLGIENKNEIEELKEKVLSLQKEIEDLKLK